MGRNGRRTRRQRPITMDEYDISRRGSENGATVESTWGGNMCLYNPINYTQVPEAYDFPSIDAPYNVDHYNSNVDRWVRDIDVQAKREYFGAWEISEFGELLLQMRPRCLLYCQPPSFPGNVCQSCTEEIPQDGGNVYVMDDASGDSLMMK